MMISILYGFIALMCYLLVFSQIKLLDEPNVFLLILVIHLIISVICIRSSNYRKIGIGLLGAFLIVISAFIVFVKLSFH